LRRFPVIAEAPERRVDPGDQREFRRQAFGALRELLARIGDRKRLILYIDDLQWGDLDSASLLSEILRPPDAPSLLLIGAYRSEYALRSPCLQSLLGASQDAGYDLRQLPVEPLSRA